MELNLKRNNYDSACVEGVLTVVDWTCYTLERPSEMTTGAIAPFCIVPGRYLVLLQKSPHFGFVTPHLQNVPGRSLIEIHPGNKPCDSEGCILVGKTETKDFIYNSRDAFGTLMAKLSLVPETEQIWITVG